MVSFKSWYTYNYITYIDIYIRDPTFVRTLQMPYHPTVLSHPRAHAEYEAHVLTFFHAHVAIVISDFLSVTVRHWWWPARSWKLLRALPKWTFCTVTPKQYDNASWNKVSRAVPKLLAIISKVIWCEAKYCIGSTNWSTWLPKAMITWFI